MKGVSLSRVCVCAVPVVVCVLPTLSLSFLKKRRFLFYLGFHIEKLQFDYFVLQMSGWPPGGGMGGPPGWGDMMGGHPGHNPQANQQNQYAQQYGQQGPNGPGGPGGPGGPPMGYPGQPPQGMGYPGFPPNQPNYPPGPHSQGYPGQPTPGGAAPPWGQPPGMHPGMHPAHMGYPGPNHARPQPGSSQPGGPFVGQQATTNVSSVYGQSPMATPQPQTPQQNPTPTSAPTSMAAANGFNQNVSQPMPNFSFNQMPKVIIQFILYSQQQPN